MSYNFDLTLVVWVYEQDWPWMRRTTITMVLMPIAQLVICRRLTPWLAKGIRQTTTRLSIIVVMLLISIASFVTLPLMFVAQLQIVWEVIRWFIDGMKKATKRPSVVIVMLLISIAPFVTVMLMPIATLAIAWRPTTWLVKGTTTEV